jgi:hypothetical protein
MHANAGPERRQARCEQPARIEGILVARASYPQTYPRRLMGRTISSWGDAKIYWHPARLDVLHPGGGGSSRCPVNLTISLRVCDGLHRIDADAMRGDNHAPAWRSILGPAGQLWHSSDSFHDLSSLPCG